MKTRRFSFIITITLLLVTLVLANACDSQLPITKPPPTKPSVSGTISGLLESDVAILRVYTETGSQGLWAERKNVSWELPVHDPKGGQYFTITAEAEGYTAEPASYRVKVEGETAYVVENGEIGEEALHLDFQFLPHDS